MQFARQIGAHVRAQCTCTVSYRFQTAHSILYWEQAIGSPKIIIKIPQIKKFFANIKNAVKRVDAGNMSVEIIKC